MRASRRVKFSSLLLALVLGFALCQQALADPPVAEAYSTFDNGPIFVPGSVVQTFHDIATLDVTPGLYVIFAKGYFKTHGGGGTLLECRLIAGADNDRVKAGADGRDDHRTNYEDFTLNVLHNFTSSGSVVLKCACDADDADLGFVKITAMRVNSFWNVPQ
jgi:hypothetical protein